MSIGNGAFQDGESQDDAWQQAQEQEHQEWIESIEGSYLCPYCETISAEQKTCCGENHMSLISEMDKQKEKLG